MPKRLDVYQPKMVVLFALSKNELKFAAVTSINTMRKPLPKFFRKSNPSQTMVFSTSNQQINTSGTFIAIKTFDFEWKTSNEKINFSSLGFFTAAIWIQNAWTIRSFSNKFENHKWTAQTYPTRSVQKSNSHFVCFQLKKINMYHKKCVVFELFHKNWFQLILNRSAQGIPCAERFETNLNHKQTK